MGYASAMAGDKCTAILTESLDGFFGYWSLDIRHIVLLFGCYGEITVVIDFNPLIIDA